MDDGKAVVLVTRVGRGTTAILFTACVAFCYGALTLAAWVTLPSLALGWDRHAIVSGSMLPGLQVGDVVLTATPPSDTLLGEGTVITFDDPAHPGSLTTHRIVGVEEGRYRTKGDANRAPDSTLVPPENVRGVGRLVVPRIGLPAVWQQEGRSALAVAALASVLAAWAFTWWYESRLTGDVVPEPDTPPTPQLRPGPVPGAGRRATRRAARRAARRRTTTTIAGSLLLVLSALATSVLSTSTPSEARFTDASSPAGTALTAGFWAVQVTAGAAHSCGLRIDGTVWCWGANANGELGNGTLVGSSVALPTAGVGGSGSLSSVLRLASGPTASHTCAIRRDLSLVCWGENGNGQLGDGTTTDRTTPVVVPLSGVVQVAPGTEHTCASVRSGAVYCWGRNDKGQLGNGTTSDRATPAPVAGVGGAGTLATARELASTERLASGEKHSCAVRADSTVVCWGQGDRGQLGDNTTSDRSLPVVVTTATATPLTGAVALGAGKKFSCATTTATELTCWGENNEGQLGDGTKTDRSVAARVRHADTTPLTGIVEVHGGESHTCARTTTGTATCWGRNDKGQLGNGTTTSALRPVTIPTLTDLVDLAAAGKHGCAATSTGGAWCWGLNSDNQLGDTTGTDRLTPRRVFGS